MSNPLTNPSAKSNLNPRPTNLLPLRHLGRLPLRHAELQALVVPPLQTQLVEDLLLLAGGGGPVLPAAPARLERLDQRGVIPVERVALEVRGVVLAVGEFVGAEFGVGPAGSWSMS